MKHRGVIAVLVVAALSMFIVVGVNEAFSTPDKVRDSLRKRRLVFSHDARERMEQLKVSARQVNRTVTAGEVNGAESDPPNKYAVELRDGGRRLRAILAPYLWVFATVVTVSDLDN